jgi:hypothetical protein
LVSTLASWCDPPRAFEGNATGRAWSEFVAGNGGAKISFSSNHGDGVIELRVDDSNWVRAEVLLNGTLIFRAWADEPYEEKEFWPEAADGVIPEPNRDAPGRISKRGAWLQVDLSRFPNFGGAGSWAIDFPS